MKHRLLLIASEQLAPHLAAFCHFKDELDGVEILHSADATRSGDPAKRLDALFRKIRPDLPVQPHEVGTMPQEIHGAVKGLLDQYPSARWVIHASGGLKTMTLGLAPFARLPKVRMIYSEIGKGWLEIRAGEDGTFSASRMEPQVDENLVDRVVSIRDYIVCQDQDHSLFTFNLQKTPVDKLLGEITGEAILQGYLRHRGDWRKFARVCKVPDSHSGFILERVAAEILMRLGLRNLVENLVITTPGRQKIEENDICFLHCGRLVLVDCSIKKAQTGNKGALVSQISDLEGRARTLGGREARSIMLRPGYGGTPPTAEALVAAKGILFLDGRSFPPAVDLSVLMGKLAGFLGLPPSAVARASLSSAGPALSGSGPGVDAGSPSPSLAPTCLPEKAALATSPSSATVPRPILTTEPGGTAWLGSFVTARSISDDVPSGCATYRLSWKNADYRARVRGNFAPTSAPALAELKLVGFEDGAFVATLVRSLGKQVDSPFPRAANLIEQAILGSDCPESSDLSET